MFTCSGKIQLNVTSVGTCIITYQQRPHSLGSGLVISDKHLLVDGVDTQEVQVGEVLGVALGLEDLQLGEH